MRWPDWLSHLVPSPADDNDRIRTSTAASPSAARKPQPVSWTDSLNAPDWSQYTSARTIVPSLLLTAATLALVRLYKLHLRRIPTAPHIPPSFLRTRSVYGYVTSVGDGDNFRLFHTPGGRLAGWGWAPGRRVARLARDRLKDNTIHVRVAGVDAPELAHFGRPAQPGGQDALEGLKALVLHRYVRARVWRKDQYERVVASVSVRNWFGWRTDVGLEMLRRGYATVYEAKFGSEFGSREAAYRAAEQKAKAKGVGIWKGGKEPGYLARILGRKGEEMETPRQYKDRMNAAERGEAGPKETAKKEPAQQKSTAKGEAATKKT
ncbi:hypothetical protein MBLNU459_g1762t1 [Dothideomycetes sp. NU459]